MNNYFPYGLKVKEGSWSASNYQFAYNGKQEESFDDDFLHYGARSYNNGLGSFIKRDPFELKFFNQSPYVYAGNNPILFNDKNGEHIYIYSDNKFIRLGIKLLNTRDVEKNVLNEFIGNDKNHLIIVVANFPEKRRKADEIALTVGSKHINKYKDNYIVNGIFDLNMSKYKDEVYREFGTLFADIKGKKAPEGDITLTAIDSKYLPTNNESFYWEFLFFKGINTKTYEVAHTLDHEPFCHYKLPYLGIEGKDNQHDYYETNKNSDGEFSVWGQVASIERQMMDELKKISDEEFDRLIKEVENEIYKPGEIHEPE